MPGPGSLRVRVVLDRAHVVGRVDIASTRPAVSTLLSGRPPEAGLALTGLLFQVCRHAQVAAARAALQAAGWRPEGPGGVPGIPAAGGSPHEVATETLQEHLWRLLLDWPAAFALEPLHDAFRRWHAALRAAPGGGPADLLPALEQEWLGLPATEWLALDSLEALTAWSRDCHSPAAALCARVAQVDSARQSPLPAPLLDDQPAAAVRAGWASAIDDDFAARPHCQGEARETGVLAWQVHSPLVAAALRQHPARVLARLLARIRDTLAVLSGGAGTRIDAAGDGAGDGLALVRTARGLLVHQVRLREGRVAAWRVVAPTEWNFHPAGSLVRALLGLRFPEPTLCERWVRAQLLSLDPCVEHRIELQHA